MTREERNTRDRTRRAERSERKRKLLRKGGTLSGKRWGPLLKGWKLRLREKERETEKRKLRGIRAEVKEAEKTSPKKTSFFRRIFGRRGG